MLSLERVYRFIIMPYPETQVTSPRIRLHLHIVLQLTSHLWMLYQLLVVLSPSWFVGRLDSDQEVLRMSTSVCIWSLGWCFQGTVLEIYVVYINHVVYVLGALCHHFNTGAGDGPWG